MYISMEQRGVGQAEPVTISPTYPYRNGMVRFIDFCLGSLLDYHFIIFLMELL